jgi:GH24 family phage-related lysozyme (muramidase)
MIRSSQKAIDLIVAAEIGSKAQYEKLYKHPTWPGGKSGVTIGIGYDLGYTDLATFGKNFNDVLDAVDFHALALTLGKTGEAAHAALPDVKHIVISWDEAMKVFMGVDLQKYENMLIKACPNSVAMPGDCFGALTSIVYNRGPAGFHLTDERFREMRTIAQLIAANNFAGIPAQIRSMKRLWGSQQQGLIIRRENEAKLFEQGLRVTSQGTAAPAPTPVPTTSPSTTTTTTTTTTATPDPYKGTMSGEYSITVELLQTKLVDRLGYLELGTIDGRWGGRTRGAVTAFMNDRHQPANNGYLTAAVMEEVNKAITEKWKRPIADERANATPDEVDKKLPTVSQSFWQQIWATLLGVPTAVGALVKMIFGDQPTPSGYIEPIKSAVQSIPPELYLVVVACICVAVFVQAKRVQNTTTNAYREGKIN